MIAHEQHVAGRAMLDVVRIDDPAEIKSLLSTTMLAGRSVGVMRCRPPGDPVFVVPCRSDEIIAAHKAARSVVPQTGRWPVVTMSWSTSVLDDLVLATWPPEVWDSVDDVDVDHP